MRRLLIMASLVACVLFTASVLSPSNMILDSEGNLDWTSARDDDYCEQYDDNEQGCINDSLCEPEYDDGENHSFDGMADANQDCHRHWSNH